MSLHAMHPLQMKMLHIVFVKIASDVGPSQWAAFSNREKERKKNIKAHNMAFLSLREFSKITECIFEPLE